ncbi:hypothetical protein BMS3Bbin04_01106 [bacterium BMS3Bbin04]|nr:hypothetical protein BMS3Bbin04_01106 [bacterium BMS3Bbin04]
MRWVVPVYPVEELHPFITIRIHSLDIFNGFFAAKIKTITNLFDALFLAGKHPYPENTGYPRQEQVSGVTVIDEVSLECVFTEDRGNAGQIEFACWTESLLHVRWANHRGL